MRELSSELSLLERLSEVEWPERLEVRGEQV
jgi:hypothetical protein